MVGVSVKMTKSERTQEVIKIMRWIAEEREMLETITDPNRHDDMTAEDFIRILNAMRANKIEYLIPIFLYFSSTTCLMDYALKSLFFEGLADRVATEGFDRVMEKLKDNILHFKGSEENSDE